MTIWLGQRPDELGPRQRLGSRESATGGDAVLTSSANRSDCRRRSSTIGLNIDRTRSDGPRVDGPLSESGNAGQYLVGTLGPDERLRIGLMCLDELLAGRFELRDTAERATTNPLHRELDEPAFHEAEPRAIRRGEVDVEARATISRPFSTSSGSFDSLNLSLRCGCNPNVRQMRLMAM
jgi:hypothetical protein